MKRKGKNKKIRVAELFAGVGGFRLGLEASNGGSRGYEIVWSNQWEPATKGQHASDTYMNRFSKEGHSNEDIAKVLINKIPNHDLLVGGFPCQDYSVARTLSHAEGLVGKKGVLWWQIHRIIKDKKNDAPSYLMLENVDRLLKSPAKKRGRDFAIMLASLSDLGYAVEWRIINAADYGMPQRRKRIFILGYKKETPIYKKLKSTNQTDWIMKDGLIAKAFPIKSTASKGEFKLEGSLLNLTNDFNLDENGQSPFMNTGLIMDRRIITLKSVPDYHGPRTNLKDILIKEKDVPEEFFITKKDLPLWKYLKGAKKEKRRTKSGFVYSYNEGSMTFPDSLIRPSRTIVTGEGGPAPSRFKHVVLTSSGKYRRLTPLELERLCMFPDNHTAGNSAIKRAFFMGNALVVGVIERLGKSLLDKHFS